MEKTDRALHRAVEIRTGLLFSFAFALFLLSILLVIWLTTRNNLLLETRLEHKNELQLMSNEIYDNMSRLESHIIHLGNIKAIREYLESGNPEARKEVEETFSDIIEYNTKQGQPTFDQIRLLDLKGMEKVRVNLGPRNDALVVKDEDLQDKSDRYYFTETVKLENGSAYISPLDLNVEGHVIEIPLKPVVRVSRIIYNRSQEPLGILIMNQQFRLVYRDINNVKKNPEDSWFLLNSEGYYLYHRNEARIFGFMKGRAGESNFSIDYPHIWPQVSQGDTSLYECKEGEFYYRIFNPLEGSIFQPSEPMTWYLLILQHRDTINANFRHLNRGMVIALVFILPLLMVTGFLLGRSTSRNRWYLKQLEKTAIHDGMTGLLNHQAMLDRLSYLINLSIRRGDPLCAAFIDLNDLKKINDSLGHKNGDLLIKTLARTLNSLLRNTDVAARIGGDEFLVIFPGLTEDNASKVMERISADFSARGEYIFQRKTTFSWGTAQWNPGDDSMEQFIGRADNSMYEMKKKMKKEPV